MMETNGSRPPTPPDVALQLRREAAFGCCRCGNPFIQYHHIIPWEVEHHFRPEDMMSLCPTCHAMATARAISEAKQRRFKNLLHNVKHGYAKGTLETEQDVRAVSLARNVCAVSGPLIKVDDECLLTLGMSNEGVVTISSRIYDRSGDESLEIRDNEWISKGTLPWDIQYKLNYLKARMGKGDILLEFDARQRHEPIKFRANLYKNGHIITMTPTQLATDGLTRSIEFTGCEFVNVWLSITSGDGYSRFCVEGGERR